MESGIEGWMSVKEMMPDPEEKWAKEHPVKTRQSEFLKMFPNVPFSHNTIDICPSKVDVLQKCPKVTPGTLNMCVFCKREYWLAEVE